MPVSSRVSKFPNSLLTLDNKPSRSEEWDLNILLKTLKRLSKGVVSLERSILILATVLIFCAMSAGILSRHVSGLDVWGMDEFSGHMAVWLYLIGAAYGTYTREHIKAEIVQMVIRNPRGLAIMRLITAALSAVVAGYMTLWSCRYLYESITRSERMEALNWPTAYFQAPLLMGAILMLIYFVAEAIDWFLRASPRAISERSEPC